jgi:hypothetical protein
MILPAISFCGGRFMKVLLILLPLLVILSLPLTACGTGSYGEGYNVGFDEGYNKGWQEGYEKGKDESSQTQSVQPSSSKTQSTGTLGKITLEDAEYILNLLPVLPSRFEKVDAASEGMSNADMGLGSDFCEVQLFLSDEPFQMIYGVMAILESRIDSSSFDSVMNDESMIKELLLENLMLGVIEEGFDPTEVDTDISITYPNLCDSSFLGEGFMSVVGLDIGFDTLWFRHGTVYVMLYSAYYTSDQQTLLPIGIAVEKRINQYSQ